MLKQDGQKLFSALFSTLFQSLFSTLFQALFSGVLKLSLIDHVRFYLRLVDLSLNGVQTHDLEFIDSLDDRWFLSNASGSVLLLSSSAWFKNAIQRSIGSSTL